MVTIKTVNLQYVRYWRSKKGGKTMRRHILTTALVLAAACSMTAQQKPNRMIITETDGTQHPYIVQSLDCITFDSVKNVVVPVSVTQSESTSLTVQFDKPEQCSRFLVACYPKAMTVYDVAEYIAEKHIMEMTEGGSSTINGLNGGVEYTVATLAFDKYDMACGTATGDGTTATAAQQTAHVGDFYYADGTWSTSLDASKTVIGVVFSTETSAKDKAMGWTHGYAVALNDAASMTPWSDVEAFEEAPYQLYEDSYVSDTEDAYLSDFDGFTETSMLLHNGKTGNHKFPAAEAAAAYAAEAPLSSSGWYLPSIGQWYQFCVNMGSLSESLDKKSSDNTGYWGNNMTNIIPATVNNINSHFAALDSSLYTPFSSEYNWFWSSTEYSSQKAYYLSFTSDEWAIDLESQFKYMKPLSSHVRPVIAF